MLFSIAAVAQRTPLDIAHEHVRTFHKDWGLTAQDVENMFVSDMYTNKTTGITRVYFQQRHADIPVYNAILNLSITKDGKVFHVGKRFTPALALRVNTTAPVLYASDAVSKAMEHLGLPAESLRPLSQNGTQEFTFEKGTISRENITAKLRYQVKKDKVRLSWDVFIAPVGTLDLWNLRVDAVTGEILDQNNWTVSCSVDPASFKHLDDNCHQEAAHQHEALTYSFNMGGDAEYNVWPSPFESPSHGPRTLVTAPADPVASPYGWHDTNGAAGAEYTITRGNNVHAYEDRDGDGASLGNEPDGGANLKFDFPFDPAWEPQQYVDAATTNLFFWNNVMHDFGYNYGFDEAAGNFQTNNYGNGGAGNDEVTALAQQGAETGNANNATFGTPPDGGSGTMSMFVWTSGTTRFLTVTAPASVAGGYDTGVAGTGWGAGAYISDVPVSGEVVIVDDATEEPYASDGCETIVNASELAGKIALIDRGGCEFGFKTVQAEAAGAIGVIICNFADDLLTMGAGAVGANANIPVVFINVIDCQTIRQFAGNGLSVTLVNPGQTGPAAIDGDLDNGIIAHEFGHGISNRLTGGPSQAGCLGNAEQMGEGWSDWFSLVTSVQPGDTGEKSRGIGTYALRENTNGRGIRRYPYTTNMDINPLTYASVAGNTEVHALGEVWTAMIWDLYWAFVEEYGWDPDLYNGTGGNNMAIRLVFEGMGAQPCSPGFLDGRDAILAADQAIYNGANQCLIWEVFARRGAGFSADQGTSDNAGDQKEAFDTAPFCLNAITIKKEVTDFISAGDEIEVKLTVGNFKQDVVSGVTVTDVIPDGCSFNAGSSSIPATVQGDNLVFDLGSMTFMQEQVITYTLTSSPNKWSVRQFLDDVPEEFADDNWNYYFIGNEASNLWYINDIFANSGQWSWLCEDLETPSRQALELKENVGWTVNGNRPVLRFYHLYNTEPGFDGGVVDVREVGTTSWKQVGAKMLRGGYPGSINYGTFVVPNLQAFSGSTGDEFVSTYVDLSEWAGKKVQLRFRFGTDDQIGEPDGYVGWFVDDIEFMNLFAYNTEACVTTTQGDNACAIAPAEGTIVESSDQPLDAVETLKDVAVEVFPNPAQSVLNIALASERQQEVAIHLLTPDGKTVMGRSTNVYGNQRISLDVAQVPVGFYFVKISTGEGIHVEKVIIE